MAEEVETTEVKKVYSTDPMLQGFLTREHEEKGEEIETPGAEVVVTDTTDPKKDEVDVEADAKVKAEAEAKAKADAEAEVAKAGVVDLDKLIFEKSNGKYKTFDEALAEQKEKEPEFANDESKKLYEALIAGKKSEVFEFLKAENTDYKSISDEDILFLKHKKDHPFMSDEDVKEDLKDKYKFDLSISDEEKVSLDADLLKEKEARIARAKRMAKADAAEFRNELETSRPKLEIPTLEKEVAAPVKGYDEVMEEWAGVLDVSSKTIPSEIDHKYEIEIPDGDDKGSYSTSFKIAGEDKKSLEDYVRRFVPPLGLEEDYLVDGKVNVDKIVQKGINELFGEKISRSLLRESIAKVRKNLVDSIKNIEVVPGETPPEQPLSNEDFLATKAMRY